MGVHRRWWPGHALITDIPARCLNVYDVADRLRSLWAAAARSPPAPP